MSINIVTPDKSEPAWTSNTSGLGRVLPSNRIGTLMPCKNHHPASDHHSLATTQNPAPSRADPRPHPMTRRPIHPGKKSSSTPASSQRSHRGQHRKGEPINAAARLPAVGRTHLEPDPKILQIKLYRPVQGPLARLIARADEWDQCQQGSPPSRVPPRCYRPPPQNPTTRDWVFAKLHCRWQMQCTDEALSPPRPARQRIAPTWSSCAFPLCVRKSSARRSRTAPRRPIGSPCTPRRGPSRRHSPRSRSLTPL